MESNLPNYSTQFLSSPIQHDMSTKNQMKKYKTEEKDHMAPKTVPHSFNGAEVVLGDAYEQFLQFKKMVDAYKELEQDETGVANLDKILDQIGQHITINIPNELDKLSS